MNKFTLIKVLLIGIAFVAGFGALMLSKKPDSPVEQAAEAVLKTQGIDIDFSQDDEDDHE
jgi:hypothetical protein